MKTLTPIEEDKEIRTETVQSNNAPLIHLSPLVKFIGVPFGGILGPLITWQIWKDKSEFDNFNGKEAVNFNLSFFLYKILIVVVGLIMFLGPLIGSLSQLENNPDANPIGIILSIPGLLLFIVGIGILEIIWLILMIIAAVKSGSGKKFKYPLSIHFIK